MSVLRKTLAIHEALFQRQLPLRECDNGSLACLCPSSLCVFFDPYAPLFVHERNLPHWEQPGAAYFLTWRLHDSLPREKLRQWKEERAIWLSLHAAPWNSATAEEYRGRFCGRIDAWLDAGSGSCVLRNPGCRAIVTTALHYFEPTRYVLDGYVIMPNHVHVILASTAKPLEVAEILKSWKGYTARAINRRQGTRGPLWQEGYWDRIVRNEAHLQRCRTYIRNNPTNANLGPDSYTLFVRENGGNGAGSKSDGAL